MAPCRTPTAAAPPRAPSQSPRSRAAPSRRRHPGPCRRTSRWNPHCPGTPARCGRRTATCGGTGEGALAATTVVVRCPGGVGSPIRCRTQRRGRCSNRYALRSHAARDRARLLLPGAAHGGGRGWLGFGGRRQASDRAVGKGELSEREWRVYKGMGPG